MNDATSIPQRANVKVIGGTFTVKPHNPPTPATIGAINAAPYFTVVPSRTPNRVYKKVLPARRYD